MSPGPNLEVHRTLDEPQLRIALQGAGETVVLSHALGLDLTMWDGLAEQLARTHRVVRHDHRGHGGSAAPPGPYTMDVLVDDAARLVRRWGHGPVIWIGLSMGAMVGQGLAIRHPELVKALVLANTTARYPEAARAGWAQRIAAVEAGGMAAVADAVVERYLSAEFRAAHPQAARALRDQVLRNDPRGYVANCHAVQAVDWLDRLDRIRAPTLVIAGAHDVGATPPMARDIAQRIEGAQFVLLETSHLSVAEMPGNFAEAVLSFIERTHPH